MKERNPRTERTIQRKLEARERVRKRKADNRRKDEHEKVVKEKEGAKLQKQSSPIPVVKKPEKKGFWT